MPLARLTAAFTGVFMHMSGDMYNGEFACNDMEGCGVYRTSDGAEMSGESAAEYCRMQLRRVTQC